MAKDYYRALRAEMQRQDVDTGALAEACGCSRRTINDLLAGKSDWRLGWMYAAMDILGAPYTDMPILFPRGGMFAGDVNHAELSKRAALEHAIRDLVDVITAAS